MHPRAYFFAAAAALAVFAASAGTHAQPVSPGFAWSRDDAGILKVSGRDYGYYGYRDNFYYQPSPFDLPGQVIGGLAGIFEGIFNGGYGRDPYYSRPLYVSPYYGSPLYRAEPYDYRGYESSPYNGGSYDFGSGPGGSGNDGGRRYASDRGYDDLPRYRGARVYDDRRYESDRGHYDRPRDYGGLQYSDDRYNAWGSISPYGGDAYIGRRTGDDDDDD
jgi:hypothetical protein